MIKTYLELFMPGSFFPETSVREVANRDMPTDLPANCYGFRFYDRAEVLVDGETLVGAPKNISGMTFFGEQMSLDDVEKLPGDNRILISNFRGNRYPAVVRTFLGNFQPVTERDIVIHRKLGERA